MLRKSEGYLTGPQTKRTHNLKHCFLVDNLKLYAKNMDEKKQSLALERRKSINKNSNLSINDLIVSPQSGEECYRYLRVDKNITYNGTYNKTHKYIIV